MTDVKAQSKVVSSQVEAVVIRANGTIEDKGIVSFWSSNFIKRIVWKLKRVMGFE